MATTTRTIRRSIASLNLSPKKVPALVTYAHGIVKAMTGNPAFPNSAPALAAVTTAINALQAAETAGAGATDTEPPARGFGFGFGFRRRRLHETRKNKADQVGEAGSERTPFKGRRITNDSRKPRGTRRSRVTRCYAEERGVTGRGATGGQWKRARAGSGPGIANSRRHQFAAGQRASSSP